MAEETTEEKDAPGKKRIWKITVEREDNSTILFNVIARTVNAALSKSSKYKKTNGMEKSDILGIESIAVVDY